MAAPVLEQVGAFGNTTTLTQATKAGSRLIVMRTGTLGTSAVMQPGNVPMTLIDSIGLPNGSGVPNSRFITVFEAVAIPAGITSVTLLPATYVSNVQEWSGIDDSSVPTSRQSGVSASSGNSVAVGSPVIVDVESVLIGCSTYQASLAALPITPNAPWVQTSERVSGANSASLNAINTSQPLAQTFLASFGSTGFGGVLAWGLPIAAYVPTPPTIVGPIPDQAGTVGVFFTLDIKPYFSGATSYTSNGTLPPGVTLDGSAGIVSGDPTTAGVYTPNIVGVNVDGVTANNPVRISILMAAPVWSVIPPQTTTQGNAVNFSVAPYCTGAGLTFSATGLPAGLSCSAAGLITGAPTTIALYTPVIHALNGGGETDSAPFNWDVTAAAPNSPILDLPPSVSGNETLGAQAYDLTSYNTGGAATSWSIVSGAAPGMTISNAGLLSVNWTTNQGTWIVTIRATNSQGSSNSVVQFLIASGDPKLNTQPPSPRYNTVGDSPSISMGVYISGATSWSATGLPPNAVINASSGIITGTLTTANTYNPVVTAVNTHGQVQTTWQWIVEPVPPPGDARYGRV